VTIAPLCLKESNAYCIRTDELSFRIVYFSQFKLKKSAAQDYTQTALVQLAGVNVGSNNFGGGMPSVPCLKLLASTGRTSFRNAGTELHCTDTALVDENLKTYGSVEGETVCRHDTSVQNVCLLEQRRRYYTIRARPFSSGRTSI
jgi:hypothetical protein